MNTFHIKKLNLSDKKGKTTATTTYESNQDHALRDLALVVLTSISYTNFEVSIVKKPNDEFETSYTTGIHVYF